MIHLLLIDDNPDDRILALRELRRAFPDLQAKQVTDESTLIQAFAHFTFDIVITDYRLGWTDGLAILRDIKSRWPNCPVIMFTDSGSQELAVEAIKSGLDDYLIKSPKHLVRLPVAVRSALNRKQAETAERQWAQLFHHAQWGVAVGSADGHTLIRLNPAFAQMHGYTVEELTGQSVLSLFAPECHMQAMQAIQMVPEQGHYIYESTHRRKDGTCFPVLIDVTAVKNSLGEILYRAVNVQDITERKRIEAEREYLLAQSQAAEQRSRFLDEASRLLTTSLDYRSVLNAVVQLAVPTLADWCFIDICQPPSLQITETVVAASDPTKEALVMELRRRYPPPPDANYGNPKVMRTGQPELVTEIPESLIPAVAEDEEHRQLLQQLHATSYMMVPLMARERTLGTMTFGSAQGERRFGPADLAMANELAQRIALAIDNAHLYQTAQEANRIKDEFLAIVSHELRTPLNAILGWAQMLLSQKLNPVSMTKAMETIERNAKLQSKLIDDILDISRIVQNKIRLNVEPVHLVPVINAVLDDARPLATAKAIQLNSMLDPMVAQVEGDAERLQQIIWNLVSNAIKFTPEQGQVMVQLAQVGAMAQITVRDTGQGISPTFLPHVFDRFRQANNLTTRSQSGLGLGLAIVHHLVEMHNGTVSASSEGDGHGATFTVQLPTQPQSSPPLVVESRASTEFPDLSGVQVLLVDDDVDTLELLTFILEQSQAQVTAVSSVPAALEKLAGWWPHLLISDIGMPEADGYELIRAVRQLEVEYQQSSLPAIALTAFARAEERLQVLAAGFNLHLAKPVEPEQLLMAIQQVLA